jgi:Domain of unknown function (DUF3303)
VVERDNPADIIEASAKFSPLKVFTVHPVIDMADCAQKLQEGVDLRSRSAESAAAGAAPGVCAPKRVQRVSLGRADVAVHPRVRRPPVRGCVPSSRP